MASSADYKPQPSTDTDETETKSVVSEEAEQERSMLEQSLERMKDEPEWKYRLRKNHVKLMEKLNPDDMLTGLSGSLGDGAVERIRAYRCREDRTWRLLDAVKGRHKFDDFCRALAGLNPDLFKLVTGRDPAKEEIEFVLGNYPEELKKVIKSKGHATDKDHDHKIDFASGYIQLSATDVDFKQRKKDIAMKELLETVPGGRSIRRVVVKGRGGVGKTTTSQWFCSQWADGNWGSEFSMVFSVRARVVMNSKEKLSLLELLKHCTSYATQVLYSLTPACLKTWLKYHSERVLIIIDGLDEIFEFSEMYKNSSRHYDIDQEIHWSAIIVNVLRGNLLREATVVSFSRSFPGLEAISPDRTCEIEGLTPDGVLEYIRTFTSPDKTEIVLATVTGHPILHSLCSITFYCAVMCKILDSHTEAVGRCMTYGGLIAFIILRYLARSGKRDGSTLSAALIVERNTDLILSLARMSAHGYNTNSRKIVFDDNDLISAKVDVEKARNSGLVIVETHTTTSLYWPTKTQAEFSHLNFGDYLATMAEMQSSGVTSEPPVYRVNERLSLLFSHAFSDDESVAALRNCFIDPAQLQDFQQKLKEILKKECSVDSRGKALIQSMMKIAHESQKPEITEIVAREMLGEDTTLDLSRLSMTAVDCLASMSMVEQHSIINDLRLEFCRVDRTSVVPIAQFLQSNSSLKTLSLHGNRIGDQGAKILSAALRVNRTLENLDLDYNGISDSGGDAIRDALDENRTLKWLGLINNEFSGPWIKASSDFPISVKVLTLRIGNLARLTRGQEIEFSQLLCVAGTSIGSGGLEAIAQMLSKNKTLEIFRLANTEIDDVALTHLADSLSSNSTCKYLRLSGTKIGPAGVKALAQMLSENSTLIHLDLDDTHIDDVALTHLADSLSSNRTCRYLRFYGTKTGPASFTALAQMISENSTLKYLEYDSLIVVSE